jgi:hypothetical protein
MFSGILEAGETERLTPRFEDGVAFQVVGVCDTDCSDLEIEATESGMWEIVATAYEKGMWGEYALEVSVEGASGGASIGTAGGVRRETGSLAPGDETLGSGEDVDDYYFTGSAGEEVIIDLRAVDFDPYLLIVAPDDEQEENDDYEGDVSRSLVRFTLPPMSGEYRVAVTSYARDETGRYDLSIQQGVAGADAGGPVSERGTLAAGDETLRIGGPQSGFQHFVADRGSIGPDEIIFR